jgi:hypothetical protein
MIPDDPVDPMHDPREVQCGAHTLMVQAGATAGHRPMIALPTATGRP